MVNIGWLCYLVTLFNVQNHIERFIMKLMCSCIILFIKTCNSYQDFSFAWKVMNFRNTFDLFYVCVS